MIASHCQRWRERRGTYRIAGEPIQTRQFEVALMHGDKEASHFVRTHHYSGAFVAARLRVGLYRGEQLVGVAVFSQPASQAALCAALPVAGLRGVELGRFVLLDEVPANGESWFLARAFKLAREAGFDAVAAHSDPSPRWTREGQLLFPGHIGTIYQSTNGHYTGMTPSRTWRLFADGTVFSARAWSKLRARERGWRYAVEQLVSHGASTPSGDWQQWVRGAVQSTTRAHRHPGTLRYVWGLERALHVRLSAGRSYPKFDIGRTLHLPLT